MLISNWSGRWEPDGVYEHVIFLCDLRTLHAHMRFRVCIVMGRIKCSTLASAA